MAVLVVMGVSGSGKSTVARVLANRLGWDRAEGDDFHPAANVAKMASGHPLTDEDRWPWLRRVSEWITDHVRAGENGVITCSALRRSYRDMLRGDDVTFVHLTADRAVLEARLGGRHGHYMPASLLQSQLDTLEIPDEDEQVLTVDVSASPSAIVDEIVRRLAGVMTPTPEAPSPA